MNKQNRAIYRAVYDFHEFILQPISWEERARRMDEIDMHYDSKFCSDLLLAIYEEANRELQTKR